MDAAELIERVIIEMLRLVDRQDRIVAPVKRPEPVANDLVQLGAGALGIAVKHPTDHGQRGWDRRFCLVRSPMP